MKMKLLLLLLLFLLLLLLLLLITLFCSASPGFEVVNSLTVLPSRKKELLERLLVRVSFALENL